MGERTVFIAGQGSFGRLLAGILAPHARVLVHDPAGVEGTPAGAEVVGPEASSRADIVIPAVNLQRLADALADLGPRLREGALVADVTSLKVEPVDLMRRLLPQRVQILGTHPLFGPRSVEERGLRGQRVALCPVRIDDDTYASIRSLLGDGLGLTLVETTPEEHDRQMALVQALTHLVGHAAAELALDDLPLGTLAYQRLRELAANISMDSPELFDAIQTRNPYAGAVRARFVDAVQRVRRRAGDGIE